ncbi:MAG: response regulator [Chloroflexi bacterium]|nr:response regulator [Chloroflexota bacterium]
MTQTPTIVVIEDTPEVLELIDVLLSDEGFEIVRCTRAENAFTTIEAANPVLAIVDLRMAGVSDWELIDVLMSDERSRHLPLIVCSGAVGELRAAQPRLQAHGSDILPKPFDILQLVDMVHRLVGGQHEPRTT